MTESTILIADDDQAIRTVLAQALARTGYRVRTTGNAATLWRWVSDGEGDLVVTDVILPDENGLDLIPRIRKVRPDLRIVVMSAQNTLLTAVTAAQRGAFEYLPKPFDLNELISVVKRALTVPAISTVSGDGHPEETEEQLPLIGRSPAMQEIYRTLARLIGTDLTVTISGESGRSSGGVVCGTDKRHRSCVSVRSLNHGNCWSRQRCQSAAAWLSDRRCPPSLTQAASTAATAPRSRRYSAPLPLSSSQQLAFRGSGWPPQLWSWVKAWACDMSNLKVASSGAMGNTFRLTSVSSPSVPMLPTIRRDTS